jgi:hypothetical protein
VVANTGTKKLSTLPLVTTYVHDRPKVAVFARRTYRKVTRAVCRTTCSLGFIRYEHAVCFARLTPETRDRLRLDYMSGMSGMYVILHDGVSYLVFSVKKISSNA